VVAECNWLARELMATTLHPFDVEHQFFAVMKPIIDAKSIDDV